MKLEVDQAKYAVQEQTEQKPRNKTLDAVFTHADAVTPNQPGKPEEISPAANLSAPQPAPPTEAVRPFAYRDPVNKHHISDKTTPQRRRSDTST